MKASFNSILFTALLFLAGCSQSNQSNEAASDTASVFDTTRSQSATDTASVQNVEANGTQQSTAPTQHQEATGKQGPMTSIGKDTTGKQEHDNLSDKNPNSKKQ